MKLSRKDRRNQRKNILKSNGFQYKPGYFSQTSKTPAPWDAKDHGPMVERLAAVK